jgi:hypothetical protein
MMNRRREDEERAQQQQVDRMKRNMMIRKNELEIDNEKFKK